MKAVICGAGIAGLALAHRMATLDDARAAVRAVYGSLGWLVPEALHRCPPPAEIYVLAGQLARPDPIETRLRRYEQLMRPSVVEKQKLARHSARWFLPETALQLRIRRIAMRLGRLPGIDRYVTGVVAGKSTALITNLRRESDSPVLTGAEPGAHR